MNETHWDDMENWSDFKNTPGVKEYLKALEDIGTEIYYVGNFPWIDYRGCLQPAISDLYEPPKFSRTEIRKLLKEANLPLARWSSDFTDDPTEWWWVVRRAPFSIDALSAKARNQIRKGLKNCRAEIVDPVRLASTDGYDCYAVSCRSRKKACLSKNQWEEYLKSHIGFNIFDLWGVFLEDKVIGCAHCTVVNKGVNIGAIWYDPAHLKHYPIYALIFSILDHYLGKKQFSYVTNGSRSIGHDTQMQDFLIQKFNFKKEFCRLRVVYSESFESLLKVAFLFRPVIHSVSRFLPLSFFQRANTLMKQEEIRRSFVNLEKGL